MRHITLGVVLFITACGGQEPIGPDDQQHQGVAVTVGSGYYWVCVHKTSAYRQGSVGFKATNTDSASHEVELGNLSLRLAGDGKHVAEASGFGLSSGPLPDPLAPGAKVDESLGFGVTQPQIDDLRGKQVIIDVQVTVDGTPLTLSTKPFSPKMDYKPNDSTHCAM
jgi:hypothetical protein